MDNEAPVAVAPAAGPLRVLVLGAGVIGSVYAGRLLQAGHHVVMLARVQATGYLAVLFEVVYTITDIPLRPLDRILPTIRLGAGFAFPLSFPVLLIALYIVRSQVASL